ncbi:GAF domain-containing protein [Lentzea sp. NPDC042327]|uniref:GAF domain-containing sensor histidine kinase n=1 Tax=Lentzea sp. NPDC042327 TaxID=3154801 RepID=UPI0033C24529
MGGGNLSTDQRLLDVVLSLADSRSLPDLLHLVVESACDLVDAPYGALAVVNGHRELVEWSGQHPGHITAGDPRSIDDTHFIGAAIQVGGEDFGNLHLAGKPVFGDDDRERVATLAAAAGVAIEKQRDHDRLRKRETWLTAAAEVTTALLTGTTGRDALYLVAQRARVAANANFSALVLPDHAGELVIEVTDGGTYDAEGMRVPRDGTVSYRVYETGRAECHEAGQVDLVPGPLVVVPMSAGERTLGVLIVARTRSQPPFEDLELVQAFAAQAALVLEFTEAQGDTERIAVLEDRDRIARDLHDLVIQRLFGLGLGLQGLTGMAAKPQLTERITGLVEEVDHTIREIRRTIFSLQEPLTSSTSLRGQLLRAVHDSAQLLGFEPDVSLEGPLDSVVPDELRPDLVATLREALTNVARHARATRVKVAIGVDRELTGLELTVQDDGRGLPSADDPGGEAQHAGGLANMAARARRHHGNCAVDSVPGAGVRITWSVPLVLQEARWR